MEGRNCQHISLEIFLSGHLAPSLLRASSHLSPDLAPTAFPSPADDTSILPAFTPEPGMTSGASKVPSALPGEHSRNLPLPAALLQLGE